MILVALAIGAILIVAAIRNSQGALFDALRTDVPPFVVWAAAIVAVGSLGYVPGLKGPSRALLALVLLVIILRNYTDVLAGFQNAWQHPPAAVASQAGTSTAAGSSGSSGATGDPTSLIPNLTNILASADPKSGATFGGHSAGGFGG